MNRYTFYAYVDYPGEKPLRNTIGIEAVKGYTDSQGLPVPARYDELIPNQEGVFKLDSEHENHLKRTAHLKTVSEKLKRQNKGAIRLVGPFNSIEECLKEKYNARPKTQEEQLHLAKADARKLETENSTLREKLAGLQTRKKKAAPKLAEAPETD